MKQILLSDFRTFQPLGEWQKAHGLGADHISPHISLTGDRVACDGELILSEQIINVFESLRERMGCPLSITSGYRTPEHQKELQADPNYQAAKNSPHVRGYALDIAGDHAAVDRMVKFLRPMPGIRIGWQQYRAAGQSFVHVDVAPMAYAALRDESFPEAWKHAGLEW